MQSLETLHRLTDKEKLSVEEAKAILDEYTGDEFSIISTDVLAFLLGYSVTVRTKTEDEVEKELLERERKHKKAVKFAKKKKLPEPEMDTTPIETEIVVLEQHQYGRNVKEDFVPSLSVYTTYSEMMDKLQEYQVFNVELRGKTGNKQEADERNLMGILDPVYRQQGHVVRAWREIQVDYQLASNNVIFNETLKDFANFFAYLTEYQKVAAKLLKSEPRLKVIYEEIFSPFDAKANLFAIALEEALTLCAGVKSKHNGVPAQLGDSKKLFWDTFKSSTKEAKEFFK